MREIRVGNSTIRLVIGDITELATDAIVNAANEKLIMGGGVAGAIRKKGGASIQQECNEIGGTFAGGAVITKAGNLKAKHVIHAVGPKMGEGEEELKLKNATLNSLSLMDKHSLKTIAFPAISTGIYGYPIERCSKIMIETTWEYLSTKTQIKQVIFCLHSESDFKIFGKELNRYENGK